MKMECNFFTGSARILNQETGMDVVREMTKDIDREEPFFVLDVGELVQRVKVWRLKMPRVKPFYAVKCNDNQTVLELLAALGTGFDCASKGELKKVLGLGVEPSRIIFANPCKPASHIRYAKEVNVPLMTFDNETELHKIKAYYPEAQLVLRIRCDAKDVQCPLGIKFGAMPSEAEGLVACARALDLDLVGVSFHVGSGCREPEVFTRAIADAKMVFEVAEGYGYKPSLLDVGGGFLGHTGAALDDVANIINNAIDTHFPESSGVKVIAEPGRYMVTSAFTLATSVMAKREVLDNAGHLESTMYYVNDSIYHSFNNTIMDHQVVVPALPADEDVDEACLKKCSIWGRTCDGLDQIVEEAVLPELQCGEWLVWRDMGAYTVATATHFNGFPPAEIHVVIPHHTWIYLEEVLGATINFKPANHYEKHEGACHYPDVQTQHCSPHGARMEDQMAFLNLLDVGEM